MMLKPVLVLLFACIVVSNAGNVLQLLKNRATHSQVLTNNLIYFLIQNF